MLLLLKKNKSHRGSSRHAYLGTSPPPPGVETAAAYEQVQRTLHQEEEHKKTVQNVKQEFVGDTLMSRGWGVMVSHTH